MSNHILRTIERVYPHLITEVSLENALWTALVKTEDGSLIPLNTVRHIYWMVAGESEWLIAETGGVILTSDGVHVRSIRLVRVGGSEDVQPKR